jgi:hypothetical protein
MSKRETMRSSAFPLVKEKTRKQLKVNELKSKATRDISHMLNDRIKNVGLSDLRSNVSVPLLKRQKLIKELKKKAEAKQIPKSMNMGGVMKNRGGTFKGTF